MGTCCISSEVSEGLHPLLTHLLFLPPSIPRSLSLTLYVPPSLSIGRPNLNDLVSEMKALGSTKVVTEEFAASHRMKDLMAVSNHECN